MLRIPKKWWCAFLASLLVIFSLNVLLVIKGGEIESKTEISFPNRNQTTPDLIANESFKENHELKQLRVSVLEKNFPKGSENTQEKNINKRIANLENTIKELSN